mgnify:CR=1 FL=1
MSRLPEVRWGPTSREAALGLLLRLHLPALAMSVRPCIRNEPSAMQFLVFRGQGAWAVAAFQGQGRGLGQTW